ncbi:MAG: DUF2892 domain-containing protein [Kiritimatiellae bacterium]|nr:DUF2892 domain-containing protein [Kiritimatiellia bacterium]
MLISLVYFLLLSLSWILGWYVNAVWYLLAVLLGVNLIQSAFTRRCPITGIIKSSTGTKSPRN